MKSGGQSPSVDSIILIKGEEKSLNFIRGNMVLVTELQVI